MSPHDFAVKHKRPKEIHKLLYIGEDNIENL